MADTLGERRRCALRALGECAGKVTSVAGACELAVEILAASDHDLPFVLLYLAEPDGRGCRLAGSVGVRPGDPGAPAYVEMGSETGTWPLAPALRNQGPVQLDDLRTRFPATRRLPQSDEPPSALLRAIHPPGVDRPIGVLVAGVSARLFDDADRDFFDRVVDSVATIVGKARIQEEEHLRADVLGGPSAPEARYRRIFESAGVSIWEEDFSAVKASVDALMAAGVTDVRSHCLTYPAFVDAAIGGSAFWT